MSTKHTTGEIKKMPVTRINNLKDQYVYNDKGNGHYTEIGRIRTEEDADLLIEAINVAKETGLTPHQSQDLLNKTQGVRDNLAKEKYFLSKEVKDLKAMVQELETERQRLSK